MFISVRDSENPSVSHAFLKLLELISISYPNQHDMCHVRFLLDSLREKGLESGVIHNRPHPGKEGTCFHISSDLNLSHSFSVPEHMLIPSWMKDSATGVGVGPVDV